MMFDLRCLLDEYDPDWASNFANIADAAEHFGLEDLLIRETDDPGEELYEPLNFD